MWQLWDSDASSQQTLPNLPMSPPEGTYSIDDDETTESYTLTNMSDDDVDEEDDKMFYEDAEMLAKKEEEVKMLLETDQDIDSWLFEQLRYQRQQREKKQALSRLSRSLSAFPPTEQYNLPINSFGSPTRPTPANPSTQHRSSNYYSEKPPVTPHHSPSTSFASVLPPTTSLFAHSNNKLQHRELSSPSLHNGNIFSQSSQLRTSAFSCPTSPSNSYTSLPNPFNDNNHPTHHKTYHQPSPASSLHNSTRAKHPAPRSESACRYFAANGHCRNGANCIFRHVAPTKKGRILFRDSSEDSSGSTPSPAAHPRQSTPQTPVVCATEHHGSSSNALEIPSQQHSAVSAPSSPRATSNGIPTSASAPNSPSKHTSTSPPSAQNGRKPGLPSIICKFYSVGKCRKGDSCPFVHHTTQRYQMKAKPSSTQTNSSAADSEEVINALDLENVEDSQRESRSSVFAIVISPDIDQENTTSCLNTFQSEKINWENESWKAPVPQTMEAIKSM
eukprot:TRINITY_DN1498_c1_g1_i1.p1 TRINITY_DN1498_c1_g1~~TRINITY_DN1498_c1_g1_i1.p1  ORF type:complete len:502 (+),score=96.65 TRINITY_DN1498_c1_g1_i1:508-2013(+)